MQFPAACEDFLHFCKVEKQLSQHTLDAYAFDLADFRKFRIRADTVGDIVEDDLKEYLENMVSRHLSPSTIRRRLACLRSFFRRVHELGRGGDPFARWRPKLPRRKRLPRALTRPEVLTLLNSFEPRRRTQRQQEFHMQTALRLMVATGMRVGELCKLRFDDFSPDCAVVRIHGKGSRDRVAYITDPSLRSSLATLISTRRLSNGGETALLINRSGSPMKPQSVRAKLRRYSRQAGVQRRVTPHMLRHTAATLLIETGVDIRFVQRLLGHSSIATTEIYTHVTDEALRLTLERANVLGSLGLPVL